MARAKSAYREVEERFSRDQDELYDYLREHRLEEITLCVGYWLMFAERELNRNQTEVAAEMGVSRGFLSLVLSGQSKAQPGTYTQMARAVGANPIEFFLAEGWLEPADLKAYSLPFASDWAPIAHKLDAVPPAQRRNVVVLVGAVLDTVLQQ